MATRTAYAGTITAGDTITAANNNKLPGGWIGYVEVTADQTGISAETDLTSLTVTVTVGTSRRIKVEGYCTFDSDAATAERASFRAYESTTLLASANIIIGETAGVNSTGIVSCVLTPSAGSHTYKLAAATGGTGPINLRASATNPAYLLVSDIGPSS